MKGEAVDRDEIRKACEAATAGPWAQDWYDGPLGVSSEEHGLICSVHGDHIDAQRDAHVNSVFIAGAREWVPALLAENDELRAEADDLYHRWGRQVRYLVGILSRWDETERTLCVAMTGSEPVVELGSLIADTRAAIAMARGDLDPADANALLGEV